MSVTHTLKHAIVITTRPAGASEDREETIKQAGETLTLRRPKGKDMKLLDQFDDREVEGTLHMISRLTGLDLLHVENMDAEDVTELGEMVGNLIAPGPKTGATT